MDKFVGLEMSEVGAREGHDGFDVEEEYTVEGVDFGNSGVN